MLTLEDLGYDHLQLLILDQAIDLLGEPQQTLQEFILRHPMLSYMRFDAKSYRFSAREIVDLVNERNNNPDDKEIQYLGAENRPVPSPDDFMWSLDKRHIYIDEIRPLAYVCFISDGTYVKIAAVNSVAKCIEDVKNANARPLELLFTIPISLSDESSDDHPNYDIGRSCSSVAAEVIELVFVPYLVKNGWYDILPAFDVEEYKDCCELYDSTVKKIEKVGTGIPANIKGKFTGCADNLTPAQLDKILLNNKIPPVKNEIEYFVYFVSDGQYVKIGFSENVEKRIKGISRYNHNDLTLLFTIPIGYSNRALGDTVLVAESIIHEIFVDYHVNGEWYDILDKIDIPAFQRYYGALCIPGKESARAYKQIMQSRSLAAVV